MRTERITSLVKLKPHGRCPSCGCSPVWHSAEPQTDTESPDGATLFSVHEGCNMCHWTAATPNVKIGA